MGINADTKVKKEGVLIPSSVANVFSMSDKGTDNFSPYISLKYYDADFQCFSELDKEDLKAFSKAIKMLSQMTWSDLNRQGGKRKKTGFAPTTIDRSQLPQRDVMKKISEDIHITELRLSQEARMFGFRSGAAFFLVFLDKNHRIT